MLSRESHAAKQPKRYRVDLPEQHQGRAETPLLLIDSIAKVKITERMIDAAPQEIITNDNLNASVDVKVLEGEESVKNSRHNVK